jgi:hypothetical protein
LFVSQAQLKATGTFRTDKSALLVLYGENFVLLPADALDPPAAAAATGSATASAAAAAAAAEDTERVPVLKLLNYAEVSPVLLPLLLPLLLDVTALMCAWIVPARSSCNDCDPTACAS